MADVRTRKQDRKKIKLLQKAIRRLEAEAEQERKNSPRHVNLMCEVSELRDKLDRITQSLNTASEWDDRDEDHEDRVARDLHRKSQRRDPYSQDEEYGLGYMQRRGAA